MPVQISALAKEVRLSPSVNQANLLVVLGHLSQDQVLDLLLQPLEDPGLRHLGGNSPGPGHEEVGDVLAAVEKIKTIIDLGTEQIAVTSCLP